MPEWYFQKANDGQQQGPVNTAQLRGLAKTGKLQPEDMIWRKGLAHWVKASKAKDLEFGPPPNEFGYDIAKPKFDERIEVKCLHCGRFSSFPAESGGMVGNCAVCDTLLSLPSLKHYRHEKNRQQKESCCLMVVFAVIGMFFLVLFVGLYIRYLNTTPLEFAKTLAVGAHSDGIDIMEKLSGKVIKVHASLVAHDEDKGLYLFQIEYHFYYDEEDVSRGYVESRSHVSYILVESNGTGRANKAKIIYDGDSKPPGWENREAKSGFNCEVRGICFTGVGNESTPFKITKERFFQNILTFPEERLSGQTLEKSHDFGLTCF